MKIKFIEEDNLYKIKQDDTLKEISESVFKLNSKNIEDVIHEKDILKEINIEIKDFDLIMDQPYENRAATDYKNIEILYKNMKCLSDSQASDERIWVAYSMFVFKDYMNYRWGSDESSVKNKYVFAYSKQRSLFRQGISRLWWIGRMSYDESRADPFELTKFVCSTQDFIESVFGRNIFNDKKLFIAMLSALLDFYNEGNKLDRNDIRDITKYANLLSATYILDMLSKEEIYAKFKKEILNIKNKKLKGEKYDM